MCRYDWNRVTDGKIMGDESSEVRWGGVGWGEDEGPSFVSPGRDKILECRDDTLKC